MAAPVEAAHGAEEKKKGGPNKLVLGVVLLAVVGGGGYYWKSTQAEAAEGEAKEESHDVPAAERGLVSFDPFVANLADEGGRRFVRATVSVVLESAEAAAHMNESPVLLAQARAAILDELTQQVADDLVTPEGKSELREAIAERVTAALHDIEVVDVLFSDFVVQF